MKIKQLAFKGFTCILLMTLSAGILRGQAALLVLIIGEKAATENFHFSMKLGMNYSMIHGYDEGPAGRPFSGVGKIGRQDEIHGF